MKKLIVFAMLGIASLAYHPAKAQVSINVNIGTPAYYGYNSYYAPARPVVYVNRNASYHRNYNHYQRRNVVAYRAQPYVQHRTYYSNYRPVNRNYSVKNVKYKHYNKSFKHSKGHGKGRH